MVGYLTYPLASPFLPGILEARGIPTWVIGLIFSSMTMTMFVVSPFIGPRIHILGYRVREFYLFMSRVCTLLVS